MRYKIGVEAAFTVSNGGRLRKEVEITYGKSARNWLRSDYYKIEKWLSHKTTDKDAPCANDVSILSTKDLGVI